jgi:hypothetical protein
MGPRWFVAAVFCVGCAATAKPETLYSRGMTAFGADDMNGTVEALQAFVDKTCGTNDKRAEKRCREAYVTLGKANDRLEAPGAAWAAYDAALGFAPHDGDAELEASRDKARQAHTDRIKNTSELAPVVISYRDEVSSDEYHLRSVIIALDFDPVLTKDKGATEFQSESFRRVFGGSVAAGEHVLTVETIHDCKPGGAGRCARSRIRKAWPFKSIPHKPTTIEIRALTKDGEDGQPARPAIEVARK